MSDFEDVLGKFGYVDAQDVTSRTSVADVFSTKSRCGVYVLKFHNGEFYAGKTKDIARRYGQHRNTHNDISLLYFRSMLESDISSFERELIWELERRDFRLRNIEFTSMPKGESDFDDIMDLELQKKFSTDPSFCFFGNDRNNDEIIRSKNDRRVSRLMHYNVYPDASGMLKSYLLNCVPALLTSEMSFWSATCMPDYAQTNGGVFIRVNAFWQEVFNIYSFDESLYCSIFMCRAPIVKKFGSGLVGANRFRRAFDDVQIGERRYAPGGQDQISIIASKASLAQLLSDSVILLAVRVFNMRLMKKGPNNFARSHCYAMIDQILPDRKATSASDSHSLKVPAKAVANARFVSPATGRAWRDASQWEALRVWKLK